MLRLKRRSRVQSHLVTVLYPSFQLLHLFLLILTIFSSQLAPSSSYLCIPDVHTFVEGAAGQMPPVGAERHTVNGLLVFSQRVDADPSLHVPQTNCGVKRCTIEATDRQVRCMHSISRSI